MFDMLPVPVLLRDDSYSNNLTIKSHQSLTIPNEIILGILKIIQDFPDIYRSIPESTFSSKRYLSLTKISTRVRLSQQNLGSYRNCNIT
jgi:hypothetical protein